MSYRLSFHTFPVTWNVIPMPMSPEIIVYRSSNTIPIEVKEPRFFSNLEVASSYRLKYNSNLYKCVLKPGIKLMDIRTLKYLVLEIMLNLEYDGLWDDIFMDGMVSFMTAFGLKGHIQQIQEIYKAYTDKDKCPYVSQGGGSCVKISYPDRPCPLQNVGSRISYGPVDDKAVAFLKTILGDTIDGYISPNLKTPWHEDHFNHEICLFDPSKALESAVDVTTSKESITKLSMNRILASLKYTPFGSRVGLPSSQSGGGGDGDVGEKAGVLKVGEGKTDESEETNAQGIASRGEVDNPQSGEEGNAVAMVTAVRPPARNIFMIHSKQSDKLLDDGLELKLSMLEGYVEKPDGDQFGLQCMLSGNDKLKEFMAEIVIKMTMLLYEAFKVIKPDLGDDAVIRNIQYHYRPLYNLKGTPNYDQDIYVLKPGMDHLSKNNVIENIVKLFQPLSEDEVPEEQQLIQEELIKNYTLSEMMGAVYGVLTHAGMFTLIFQASVRSDEEKSHLWKLKDRFDGVVNGLRDLFALDKDFNEEVLLKLLTTEENLFSSRKWGNDDVYDVNKGNMKNIIMDMMVNNPVGNKNVSIVRRNLNNQEYIRTRTQKAVRDTYKKFTTQPTCPVFYKVPKETKALINKGTVLMVDGDEWYEVNPTGFFRYTMDKAGRTWKAGPSGSTFMWLNMVFGLLGFEAGKDNSNYKKMLLCIIADFVPIYHSLAEVLMVYSREIPNPDEGQGKYMISMNPVEWLVKHLEGSEKFNTSVATPSIADEGQDPFLPHDALKAELDRFIKEVIDKLE